MVDAREEPTIRGTVRATPPPCLNRNNPRTVSKHQRISMIDSADGIKEDKNNWEKQVRYSKNLMAGRYNFIYD